MTEPRTTTSAGSTRSSTRLRRELGVPGSTMLGLGSIIGTGVFVSIGIAAGVAGPGVIPAIALAAFVALCNALSSAQLAASHPVSGGTYEYGYRYLSPLFGFTAGWVFLCAKSASAATAALGFAGYLLHAIGGDTSTWLVPAAIIIVIALTILVLSGIRRSNIVNAVIVSVTMIVLLLFIVAGTARAFENGSANLLPFFDSPSESGGIWNTTAAFLQASALMFVAYTGYGRIATLGEEAKDPQRTIPRAIVSTLVVSALLYMLVGVVAIGSIGAPALHEATAGEAAPLEIAAESFGLAGVSKIVAIGAITAMLGVLLNLILGLSRVLLSMGRRGDMPAAVARIDARGITPYVAVIVVGLIIAGLALIGSVKTTWSFSAFTVLVYYAITNLCALRLAPTDRRYPRVFAWMGLVGCLGLAFFVEMHIWLAGIGLVIVGIIWHLVAQRIRSATNS